MKKFIIISIFFLFIILSNMESEKIKMTMATNDNHNLYELNFSKENLNFRNIKLKLGLFTSYEYKITKVYIDYPENIKEYFLDKEYFSFDSENFNRGIEKLREEYNVLLKEKYLYDELEKDINNIKISKIEIYTQEDALTKFKSKYPNVTINRINM